MVSTEKETLLDAVGILMEQEKEQHALAVLKVAIEKSLKHMDVITPVISQLPFVSPKKEHLKKLMKLEGEIRKELDVSPNELAFEKILDYLQLVSDMTENPGYSYRKLLASLLARKSIRGIRNPKRTHDTSHVLEELLAERKIQNNWT